MTQAPILTMSKLATASKVSRDIINKWLDGHPLSSQLPSTTPGVARSFTRHNGLEISFRAACVLGGASSYEANLVAKHWLSLKQKNKLPNFWAFNLVHGFLSGIEPAGIGYSDGTITLDDLCVMEADEIEGGWTHDSNASKQQAASALLIINLAESVRRIEILLSTEDRND